MLTKNHAALETEVKAHVAADAIIAGHYWDEEAHTGCFIGCLAHSESATDVTEKYGLPLPLVRIAENIFESLPSGKGKAFFAALPNAVGRDGRDLSLVHWKFLAAELRSLPAMPSHIQDVIDPVIAGIDLLAGGGKWSNAAQAAQAAYNAESYAYYYDAAAAGHAAAAADVADHAAAAADVADVARDRQVALFLQLISDAK